MNADAAVSSKDQDDRLLLERPGAPPVHAQFFYFSSLSIDDPLCPAPPAATDKSNKHPPQPFSPRDNASLEESWHACRTAPDPRHGGNLSQPRPMSRQIFSFPSFRDSPKTDSLHSATESNTEEIIDAVTLELPESANRSTSRSTSVIGPASEPEHDDAATVVNRSPASDQHQHTLASNISGTPFARVPSKRENRPVTRESQTPLRLDGTDDDGSASDRRDRRRRRNSPKARISKPAVLVGVSRLHLVEMPDMIMKPIYWSPVNDTSKVVRATWFYKDTMLPVPSEVANLLEVGYEDIKPYLDSYQDELDACIENGASAEMKVVHKLWPNIPASTADHNKMEPLDDAIPSPFNPLPSKYENVAVDPKPCGERRPFETHSVIYVDRNNAQILRPNLLPSKRHKRRPLNGIRKGQRLGVAVVRGFDFNAWSRLHPKAKSSETPRRVKTNFGSQSDDPTTTGPSEPGSESGNAHRKAESAAPVISDLVLVIHGIGQKLSEKVDSFHFTYAINDVRRQVNVELASDAVRRKLVQSTGMMVLPVNWRRTMTFDEDMNGAAERSGTEREHRYALKSITPDTLPAVRSIVSDVMLDIPYYMSHHKGKMISAVIREANRIYRLWCANNPGFRENGRVHLIGHSLGSVIAMEILSQQPTWVAKDSPLDNGGGDDNNVDDVNSQLSSTMFEFDTTNLFICGSPCGFFLWLHNNAALLPRKGRSKPGLEADHLSASIAGEESYGCLAVDNIYNIIHRNDPISYMINAAVDADYAESLQPANIPSVNSGFWSRVVNSTLGWASSSSSAAAAAAAGTAGAGDGGPYAAKAGSNNADRPQLMAMPSTVEMETHDFTKEEIAEKRMYLLNDNGQIDFFLQSTGGPLEIQYLSMLSAHSSYWLSPDFIRFLVMEITRKPGRANTFPILRAVKKREFKKGSLS